MDLLEWCQMIVSIVLSAYFRTFLELRFQKVIILAWGEAWKDILREESMA